MKHMTGSGGWFDDERGALGGKNLREELWAAVKNLKAKRRSLKLHRESDRRTEESIKVKEAEVVQAEQHQREVERRVINYA